MYALLAFLPILVAIVLMTGFNWGAKKALPVSWLAAALIASLTWKMDLGSILGFSVYGLFKSVDVLIIIFGAILILNTLKKSGAMATIRQKSSGFDNCLDVFSLY